MCSQPCRPVIGLAGPHRHRLCKGSESSAHSAGEKLRWLLHRHSIRVHRAAMLADLLLGILSIWQLKLQSVCMTWLSLEGRVD